ILGAKISGSGLGDCILGLLKEGKDLPTCASGEVLDLSFNPEGLL
ncbi:MAG: GHMP kinase, partial [bacterium]|nr:GHMP kinase [bacterium]